MPIHRRPQLDILEGLFLVLALLLAGIHLYLGLVMRFPEGQAQLFVLIGLALLFGPVVFFTRFWESILYVLGAGFAIFLGVLWLLDGMVLLELGILTGLIATTFIILGLYLFLRAGRDTAED